MKILAGILVVALAAAMLLSNAEPSPSDEAKATRDLDANAPTQSAAPQAGATDGAAAESALAEALKAVAAAKENSPDADAALERALEQLQQARDALVPQDPCCLYAPEHCPAVADCAGQDACIIIHLPPIEYSQATYTAQGTCAFATIFSAAAARGVENASIRAMNATRVCPTCNLPHSPTTPCAKAQSPGDAPPPKSPDS